MLKEFAEEVEPKLRRCLICLQTAPDNIKTEDMTLRKTASNQGWYSNAGLKNNIIARFYLCPLHRHLTGEAWEWVREGLMRKEIKWVDVQN